MAKNKTTETQNSVAGFLTTITDEKRRKDCIYIQKLEDIDTGILTDMVTNSMEHIKKQYPG